MASRTIYSVVAVVGIAAISVAAWWYQSKPSGPREIAATPPGAAGTAAAPAGTAAAPSRVAGVEVARAERLTIQDDAQSVGTLRSRQSVMLRPEVPGRVRELGFTDGASVRRGQVLVQLDDTLQRAEIKQAQAQVSIAKANFRRNQELVAQNFVAQRVLEESQANLQVAEAQLALACARHSRMAIIAPFDGTVGMRNVNPGDFVKDGADLINLEDIGSMYVDFRLPERFLGKLRQRQQVELQLDSFPGRLFKATVEAIDPLLDVNGRSIGVRAVLPNSMGEALAQGGGRAGGQARPSGAPASASRPVAARNPVQAARPVDRRGPAAPGQDRASPAASASNVDGCPAPIPPSNAIATHAAATPRGGAGPAPLRPGMFARVTTVFAVRNSALAVPEEAIVPQGGRQFVIKVVEPSALPAGGAAALPADVKLVSLRQEVRLGVRQLGKVEVIDGLVEGETVVVAGQQRLQRDGTPVRVVELARPAQAASAARAPGSDPAVSAAAPAASR